MATTRHAIVGAACGVEVEHSGGWRQQTNPHTAAMKGNAGLAETESPGVAARAEARRNRRRRGGRAGRLPER